MLNTQEPMRLDRDEEGSVVVHSTFLTVQGEGPFAGKAALFIRLTGCNIQCPGCDTEYTSKAMRATPKSILKTIRAFYDWNSGLIVITGGEPFRQNITPLVKYLLEYGYEVQIESNGVLYPGDDFPWRHWMLTVVISPKTAKVHPKTAMNAHAYKYVLSHDSVAEDGLPEQALAHPLPPGELPLGARVTVARPPVGWRGPIYLQPMDVKDERENARNVAAVVDSVMKHRKYILGVQMHKLTGLP